VQVLTDLFGKPPTGWYTGRDSPNTRQLVVEHGGFDYDSDYYGDDLPFWTEVPCADGQRKPGGRFAKQVGQHLHRFMQMVTLLFNRHMLIVDPTGGFDYDSDYYGDDLPFWTEVPCADGQRKPHLIVPYTLGPGRPSNRQCMPIDIIFGDVSPSAYSTSKLSFR
jgi:peptidoglycan/xylan/chitin deacetylase (PgdA/CDA1 family)